jgi:hypothetical protein
MKRARWIVGIVIAFAVGYVGLMLFVRMDLVTSNYADLDEARADQLFERGWLPDILPASADDIRTTNDLDLNTSEGEFRFAAADYRAFASRLRPGASLPSSVAEYVRKMEKRGYEAGQFSDDASTWVFLCRGEGGYCAYSMWLHRE